MRALVLALVLLPGLALAQGTPPTYGPGAVAGSGGTTFANPTATMSTTAVNGVATTAMRSDASPPLPVISSTTFGVGEVDNQTIVATAGVLSTTAADHTYTSGHTLNASDMGGQANYNGSSLTATIGAISSTVFATGMTAIISNQNASALTVSSTPTINGCSGTIAQYNWWSLVSNGTSLDCLAGGAPTAGAVSSVSGTTGQITVTPTTGAAVVSLPATITSNETLSGNLTLSGTNTLSGANQVTGSIYGTVRQVSGTTDTLAATDCGNGVEYTSATAVTVTVPNSLPIGCQVGMAQYGAGKVSTSAGSGATQRSPHAYTGTSAQYTEIYIHVITNSGGSSAVYSLLGDGA